MSDKILVTLEWIGPSGSQEWHDHEGDKHVLVAGRRYQVEAGLAEYMVSHDSNYWKRPEPPKREPAAKE